MNKLYSIIIKYRNQKQFSQAYMGQKLGVSQKTYSLIESGKSQLSIEGLIIIARTLELNPCDLLKDAGLLKETVPCENEQTIRRLNSEIEILKSLNNRLEMNNNHLLNSGS